METQTLEKIIAEHPYFAGLEPEYTSLLVGCASNVRFDAGRYLWREGEEANQFYLIREGRVAIEMMPPHRKAIVVETVGEGEILGWSWLLPPYTWRFHARAVEMTRALALDGKCLRNKCEQNHDLGYELLKRFAQIINHRLDATRMQLLDLYGKR
ncbi:MAG: cyclic nucleotide-binding domain-containing protein [Acidobacteriia bacterium]|nr:cyclic nucleotide-binding domain-containing protein [Terriglobia bacterium]